MIGAEKKSLNEIGMEIVTSTTTAALNVPMLQKSKEPMLLVIGAGSNSLKSYPTSVVISIISAIGIVIWITSTLKKPVRKISVYLEKCCIDKL